MVYQILPLALVAVALTALLPVVGTPVFAQAQNDADAFFSGTVVSNSPDRVTVARTIQGKNPERRTFIINAGTTIEGHLKQNSRVTVRFAVSEEGDVALSIIVRENSNRQDRRTYSRSLNAAAGSPAFFEHLPGPAQGQ
jgi:hypothetical protein